MYALELSHFAKTYPDGGNKIAKTMQKEAGKRGTAAVMVTHDERILDPVDSVYRLEQGRVDRV